RAGTTDSSPAHPRAPIDPYELSNVRRAAVSNCFSKSAWELLAMCPGRHTGPHAPLSRGAARTSADTVVRTRRNGIMLQRIQGRWDRAHAFARGADLGVAGCC